MSRVRHRTNFVPLLYLIKKPCSFLRCLTRPSQHTTTQHSTRPTPHTHHTPLTTRNRTRDTTHATQHSSLKHVTGQITSLEKRRTMTEAEAAHRTSSAQARLQSKNNDILNSHFVSPCSNFGLYQKDVDTIKKPATIPDNSNTHIVRAFRFEQTIMPAQQLSRKKRR